jgi:hypothetical protein
MKVRVKSSHKGAERWLGCGCGFPDHAAKGSAGDFLANLANAKVCRGSDAPRPGRRNATASRRPSGKAHLPGRQSVGGKLLEKNVFLSNTALLFLDSRYLNGLMTTFYTYLHPTLARSNAQSIDLPPDTDRFQTQVEQRFLLGTLQRMLLADLNYGS